MELNDISQVAQTIYYGHDSFNVTTGKALNIETSPEGEEILSETVPVGKNWDVEIWVQIIENNN